MGGHSDELIEIARKILGLIELIAEPEIAKRDADLRIAVRKAVGGSKSKQRAVHLMDGNRTQKEIISLANIDQGDLSKLVGKLSEAELLMGDKKLPRLKCSLPSNFFDNHDQ